MAVINRCAVAVAAKAPMREWSRSFWTREDMESLHEEESLYLIPPYDDDSQAQRILADHHDAIFRSELELWCRDSARWPTPRTLDLFHAWFAVRLFPLVEDLGGEPLSPYGDAEMIANQLRQALR